MVPVSGLYRALGRPCFVGAVRSSQIGQRQKNGFYLSSHRVNHTASSYSPDFIRAKPMVSYAASSEESLSRVKMRDPKSSMLSGNEAGVDDAFPFGIYEAGL